MWLSWQGLMAVAKQMNVGCCLYVAACLGETREGSCSLQPLVGLCLAFRYTCMLRQKSRWSAMADLRVQGLGQGARLQAFCHYLITTCTSVRCQVLHH